VRTKSITNAGYNQLRWVVLLLAIAVILPTVCLLWFMSQVVRNERLAVKQKLTDVYTQRLQKLSTRLDELWSARIEIVERQTTAQRQPIKMFELLAGRDAGGGGSKICDSIIVFDSKRKLIYPLIGDGGRPEELSEEFDEAWSVEFAHEDFNTALNLYEQIAESFVDEYTRYSALMGQVRCLRKMGAIEKAVALCHKIAYGQFSEDISSSLISLSARARILLVEMKSGTEEGLKHSDMQDLMESAINYTPGSSYIFLPMGSQTRIFLLRKATEIVEESKWAGEFKQELSKAKELLLAEELAAAVLDRYYAGSVSEPWYEEDALKLVTLIRTTLNTIDEEVEWSWTEQLKQISAILDSLQSKQENTVKFEMPVSNTPYESWPEDSLFKLGLPEEAYGMYHSIGDKTYLLLQNADNFHLDLDLYGDALKDAGVSYRITDNFGSYACGLENPENAAFVMSPLGKFFPNWQIAIHFTDIDIFEKTAGKQAVLYMWAGLLAIVVMLAAGLLAARAVGRQIKTNKLKNDFIATVSHELKTPLASMRVLVDTLLEGNYRDQKQANEYLHLTSKENERLSRLIDNFLTFSRMERNKQAFNMAKTSPAEIAYDAVEAVKTKFDQSKCEFKMTIDDDLPDVRADRDAMVTVVVNLLDNACKYSFDEKKIELRAFSENGFVYFSVSDKGIGMSRRSIRKIFKRFYQADRSLSRHAEGCGLGLSITKFIVDAHKGTISVESKLGEGSTFTIRLNSV
jgi:signal transduction histidine kinase